ncbi:pirin family protein [Hydrogenivirga sp.]
MRIYVPAEVRDGAGVRLRRYIGAGELRELDPFLLLDEFKSSDPEDYIGGFPEHPHRGFQTLTYMIRGRFKHRDSTGAEGVLEGGWLQWMNAGRGVLHSELPLMEKGFLWGFQLWLNNPREKKNSEPFYHNFPAELIEDSPRRKIIDLVGPPMRYEGFYPLTYLHVELKEEGDFKFSPTKGNNTFVALSEGEVLINSREVTAPALIVPEGDFEVRALRDAVFLVGSARLLGEPVARWGPFVMNTMEEIEETIRRLKEGRFPD